MYAVIQHRDEEDDDTNAAGNAPSVEDSDDMGHIEGDEEYMKKKVTKRKNEDDKNEDDNREDCNRKDNKKDDK